jgi:hypothetical protein
MQSLDLRAEDDCYYRNPYPGLSQDYLLKMITQLKVHRKVKKSDVKYYVIFFFSIWRPFHAGFAWKMLTLTT